MTADICVIGGGSAGLCAAVSAARCGRKVILIERSANLGGMGTLAKVHTFCGLYHPDVSLPPRIVNQGLPVEIEKMMRARTGAEPVKMGKVYVLPQDPDTFAEIAGEMTQAEENLKVKFKTECVGISRDADGVFILSTSTGRINCRALVDTSADGIVADFLGATRLAEVPAKKQSSAFIFSLRNVKPPALGESFRMRLALAIVRAVKAGELPDTAMGTASRSSTRAGEIYFTTDLEPTSRAELLAQGNNLAEMLSAFLRKNFAEYASADGPFPAAEPGVRESWRWLGKYVLTEDDLINGTKFPDTVALATWPIELRETTRGARLRFFKNAEPSGIPQRCLESAEIDGVFFAGRCISASHEALASVRVMGTCFATGQAAGRLAAEYLEKLDL